MCRDNRKNNEEKQKWKENKLKKVRTKIYSEQLWEFNEINQTYMLININKNRN